MSHERGTARLIRLVMARDLKPLRRDLAVNVQGEMVYKALAAHPLLNPELVAGRDLRDDLLDRVVMTVSSKAASRCAAAPLRRAHRDQARRHRPAGAGDLAHRAGLARKPVPDPVRAAKGAPARGGRHPRAALVAGAGGIPADHAAGTAAGISALPAGHRAAAREGWPRPAARRAARGRDRAASRRATASGSRPNEASKPPGTTISAGCSRNSACRCSPSSSRRACPDLGAAAGGRLGRARANAAELSGGGECRNIRRHRSPSANLLAACVLAPALSSAQEAARVAGEKEAARDMGAVLAWRLMPETVE